MSTSILLLAWFGLLVRVGHSLHTVGAVRARSATTVAGRALLGLAVSVLACWIASTIDQMMFDDRSTPAVETVFPFARDPASLVTLLPMMMIPMAVLGGAVAERARIRGPLIAGGVLTITLIPAALIVCERVAGPGFGQSAIPLVCVHACAGVAGLVAARVIGPRNGKYNRDGSANFIPGHSTPMVLLGDFCLLLGLPAAALAWSAVDAPAAIGQTLMACGLGAATAALSALLASHLRGQRLDVMLTWSAALAGTIVGSVSSCDWAGLLGILAGVLVPMTAIKLDLKFRIDDPAGFVPIHLVGGLVGAIAVACGGPSTHPSFDLSSTGLAMLSLAISVGVCLIGFVPTVWLLNRVGFMRVSEADEYEGLDLARHDINAYPDFQQTMIKSYHLRQ